MRSLRSTLEINGNDDAILIKRRCKKYNSFLSSAASVILVYSVCLHKQACKQNRVWFNSYERQALLTCIILTRAYYNIMQHFKSYNSLNIFQLNIIFLLFYLANISLMLYLNMTTDRVFLRMEIQYIFVGNH